MCSNLGIIKVFYSNIFVLPLPDGHRFPMAKYRLLKERVAAAGLTAPQDLQTPPPASDEQILRAHDAAYLVDIHFQTVQIATAMQPGMRAGAKRPEAVYFQYA